MSLNQLAKATSLNVMTLSRILKSLQELGLSNYVKAGTSQLWRLSEGYAASVISPILNAIEDTPNIIDQLKELIARSSIPLEVEKIVLYGSVARGDYQPGSDIDLLILRSERNKEGVWSYYDELGGSGSSLH
jgi:UTP:GlnB (protein PII) uridylyltransferase